MLDTYEASVVFNTTLHSITITEGDAQLSYVRSVTHKQSTAAQRFALLVDVLALLGFSDIEQQSTAHVFV
jgi:hypothetical protein